MPIRTPADHALAADIQESLRYFSGGDTFYQHWLRIRYTEGIKYLAEKAGAYWLIDLIASHQPAVLRKIAKAGDRDFQLWKLKLHQKNGSRGALAVCEDGNGNRYVGQNIEYTDFPLDEFECYVVDGVLMLKGEY